MDIVIVAQYMRNLEQLDSGNSRFAYLADMLVSNKNDVEIITSDFFHEEKRHFNDNSIKRKYDVTLLHEPGYSKNICLQRFRSHSILSKNILKYLKKRKKPDVIYAAVPSLDVADAVAKYCKQNDVKFVVDIQDLWPEAFKMVVNIPIVSDIGFFPMKKKADHIYSAADEIVAVSQTYAERGLSVNAQAKGKIVYLGTDMERFDSFSENNIDDARIKNDRIKIVYVGTLGASYDLHTVFEAMRLFDQKTIDKIQFIIIGDGSQRTTFEKDAGDLPVVFMGMLPYCDMVAVLTKCDIAVNPIVAGSAGSIINKHADYAAAGLPVVNTQECREYRKLLESYICGINCNVESVQQVARAIEELIENPEKRKNMGANSRRMAEEKFDRAVTYRRIIKVIDEIMI